ncbi:hypothetical protein BP00DRAFT_449938 [Aspergillus indologenus CBS 114.80]|uniref:Uncharacterized protein n=1 Tax=Aspergillus indologenus CBS 114.80 TaxID=1450541 RepID=A0A2V5HTL9_9EURO|nr:hypothetical protein BP00DRAFT_449938 [Aspergillus indologenus CBS 114.80]
MNRDSPRVHPSLSQQASDVDLLTTNPRELETQKRRDNGKYGGYGGAESQELRSAGSGLATSALRRWSNLTLTFSLILGGCCANVFALEAIIKEQPSSGE